jgi:hypothetical protein
LWLGKDDPDEICPKELLEIGSWKILCEKALNCVRYFGPMAFREVVAPDMVPTTSVVRTCTVISIAIWEHSFEVCVEFSVIVWGNACVIDELIANDG